MKIDAQIWIEPEENLNGTYFIGVDTCAGGDGAGDVTTIVVIRQGEPDVQVAHLTLTSDAKLLEVIA